MNIRVADNNDVDAIAEIFKQTQDEHVAAYPNRYRPVSIERAKEILADSLKKQEFIVAEDGKNVVGYAIYEIVNIAETSILKGRKYCYIREIGVTAKNRGQGIGASLIERIKNDCDEKDIEEIELDVWAFNSEGKEFFEKVGFKPYASKMKI